MHRERERERAVKGENDDKERQCKRLERKRRIRRGRERLLETEGVWAFVFVCV